MAGSHDGAQWRDPTTGSHDGAQWRAPMAGSHGGDPWRNPMAGTHGGLPRRGSEDGVQVLSCHVNSSSPHHELIRCSFAMSTALWSSTTHCPTTRRVRSSTGEKAPIACPTIDTRAWCAAPTPSPRCASSSAPTASSR